MPVIILAPYMNIASVGVSIDPFFGSVSNLLHMDGANGGTSITDVMGNNVTLTGSPTTSTTQAKFGTASLSLNGSSHITVPNVPFAANAFTIEGWFYPTSLPTNMNFFGQDNGSGSVPKILLYVNVGLYVLECGSLGTISTNVGPVANQWTHIAIVRQGTGTNQTTVYINGVSAGTGTLASLAGITQPFHIGYIGETFGAKFPGFIDEFRITNGVARYTGNFTPPTEAFPNAGTDPNFSSVTALISFDSGIADVKGHALTNTSVTVNSTIKKIGTGSGRFNGSAYLGLPISADYDFGTGPFTIEGWVNADSVAGTNPIFTSTNRGFLFQLQGAAPVFYISGVSAGWAGNAGTVAAGTWFHYALVRVASGVCTFYLNGVATGSTPTHTEVLGSSTVAMNLGRDLTGGTFFTGYMDEFRITKGVARYIANFTPSTAPFGQS